MTLYLMLGVLGAFPGGATLIATPERADRLCHELLERPWSSDLPADPVERAALESGWASRRAAALQRSYAVEIPAGLFQLATYEDGELVFDDRSAFLGAGGGLSIFPRGEESWAVDATPEQAHRAFELRRRGQARLLVTFYPSAEGCNGVPGAHHHTLEVSPGSLELRATDGSLVLPGAGDWAPLSRESSAALRVDPPVVASGQADVAAVERAIEADRGLRGCYERALASAPDAGGDLVIEAEIGPPGVVQTSRVALDGLGNPELTACLRQRFQSLQLNGAAAGARLYVPIELGRR
ncbi:MAG: hypothetical protein ACYDCL_19985 [Myxococcales bacterium]